MLTVRSLTWEFAGTPRLGLGIGLVDVWARGTNEAYAIRWKRRSVKSGIPATTLYRWDGSYATGVFASAEIAAQCGRDATLRYLSVGVRFAPDRMRLFRGQNSELVRRCLAFVIRSANVLPTLAPNPQDTAANRFNELARSQGEADRRIKLAVQLDREARGTVTLALPA